MGKTNEDMTDDHALMLACVTYWYDQDEQPVTREEIDGLEFAKMLDAHRCDYPNAGKRSADRVLVELVRWGHLLVHDAGPASTFRPRLTIDELARELKARKAALAKPPLLPPAR